MDNQHRQIKGYREHEQTEIDLMNEIKTKGAELGELIEKLRGTNGIDTRWLGISETYLQIGLMAATRSIARPTFF